MAGDTALTYDMKLIPLLCPQLNWAALPIGDNFTMGIEEAIIASSFIDCKNIVGCHYDTFPIIELDQKKQNQPLHLKVLIYNFQELGKPSPCSFLYF